MKKTSYHVNPAVNKWEEEQRRARMEKMIQRAKSTLPPEARVGTKQGGPKKPSPYAAEANAAKAGRKQSSSGATSGPIAMDVQELDGLIYNRVQEILGMPLMRRAAAARAALKGGTSARSGRRPAWNSDWNAQAASAPSNVEERHIGGSGSRNAYERSPSKPSGGVAAGGSRRAMAHEGTPTGRAGGFGSSPGEAAPHAHGAGMQRQTSLPQATGERVTLLPSPSSKAAVASTAPARPASGRYTAGQDPAAGAGGVGGRSPGAGPHDQGHELEHSVVSAIVALNPQSKAAQAAAARNGQRLAANANRNPLSAAGARSPGAAPRPPAGSSPAKPKAASSGIPTGVRPQRLSGHSAQRLPGSLAGGRGSGQSGPTAPTRSSSAHSKPKEVEAEGGTGRKEQEREEEEDAYADDDFEEYEGSDEEHAGGGGRAGHEAEEEDEPGGAGGVDKADLAILRSSVNALNGLVQLKIQQELARSQQLQQMPRQARRSTTETVDGPRPSHDDGAEAGGAGLLASMALVGTEDAEAAGGHRNLADSGVIDGLRQSDLDYLARLGAGDPHDRQELGNSTDDRAFVIEPGAPAGTAKVWGDRQPWAQDKDKGPEAEKTGLQVLRERQEKERQKQQQEGVQGSEAGRRTSGTTADEEDSVLLGETITPRNHPGAAVQMQVVSTALAAMATSGQLSGEEAKDLRTQTDALFGSLVQLHNLMTGPRGAELRTASPTDSKSGGSVRGGGGFTPTDVSPAESPTQTMRRPGEESGGGGAGTGVVSRSRAAPVPTLVPPEPPSGHSSQRATQGGAPPQQEGQGQAGGGSHIQLTPKNRLVAEDVAWMAGLVQSLSESLHAENGGLDLPGM